MAYIVTVKLIDVSQKWKNLNVQKWQKMPLLEWHYQFNKLSNGLCSFYVNQIATPCIWKAKYNT